MKYTTFLAAFFLLVVSLASCSEKKHRRKTAEEVSQLQFYIEEATKLDTNYNHIYKTETEMYYIYSDSGKGFYPVAGDMVSVRYTCYYLDSVLINNNLLNPNPMQFTLWSNVSSSSFPLDISGLHEGIALMRNGGKATFLIPSTLAYGGNGKYDVPGYTTLRFEVEITDLIKAGTQ